MNAPGRPAWQMVTFDVDGTLTRVHGWRFIAERMGRSAEFERANRRFFAHEVGEDEHLSELVHLADGLPRGQLEEWLEQVPKVDGIEPMVRAWRSRGTRVALLTHNPSYVCAWYQRRFGFDDWAGTPVAVPADGILRLSVPLHADKPGGLRALLSRADVPPEEVVHIGDGWADVPVFRAVGAGVALNSELAEVRAAADLVLASQNLAELPGRVDALRGSVRSAPRVSPP